MQVILDSSFARPGSAPIWGGKKGEFRDWTTVYRNAGCCRDLAWAICFVFLLCRTNINGLKIKKKRGKVLQIKSVTNQSKKIFLVISAKGIVVSMCPLLWLCCKPVCFACTVL